MKMSPAEESRDQSRSAARHFAVIGAGMAGIAAARTLVQAGHRATVFESADSVGGRMASETTPFGRFDSGAQYFTVRDPRFELALATAPALCKRWSANLVRVLDAHGRVAEAALPSRESHWVAQPGMDALVAHWAAPLGDSLVTGTQVVQIEADPLKRTQWQLRTEAAGGASHVYTGFDAVLLAVPPAAARQLLDRTHLSASLSRSIAKVHAAPCWTLMIAFPQANQPTMSHLGPQWNVARSTHHRIAWLARESSKPGRDPIERWTLQASPTWSQEHLRDDAARVEAKLLRAFSEITGIHARPSYAQARCWTEAQTQVPLGKSHLWDAKARIGLAGDWCIGHRVEDAFLSGLSLALDAL
ncbi:putative NAD/FAD-dependent oxidoreductase [Variovorax ginsengisoli]|uniref:NAD/FAD-dependent oxidoreductase n=2 Tax=Variovorax ginsengisoli TaxID=363844 RepID=A0ABT9SE95_9BURK|nr:FAD-dependent oxidoreductase [Variovorax ginsengisoli]MDP9902685.1 putative NAD/FAD-dependent oxidoreductase [Variovorax ginsengisoli]